MTAREGIHRSVSPRIMILTGLAVIPSFLFQDNVLLKTVQTVLFAGLSILEGKRFKPLPPLVMIASITLINVFNPIGRIIFTLGALRITFGALSLGLTKGLTLVGLIYLSRSSVRSDLLLPGKIGRILGRTFYYFDRINERWSETKGEGRSLMNRLDSLLLDIDPPGGVNGEGNGEAVSFPGSGGPKRETSPGGYLSAAGFLLFNWGLFALSFLPAFPRGLG